MKKILLFILPLFLSCEPLEVHDKHPVALKRIDPILRSIVNRYPNYNTNGVERENAGEALEKALDSALNKDILSDLPMRIFSMGKSRTEKGSIVYFTKDASSSIDTITLSNMTRFDLIGLMPEKMSSQLNEKEVYYVHGHNYRQLNHDQIMSLVSLANNTPYVGIMSGFAGGYEFLLGDIAVDVDSVTAVPASIK